MSENNWFGYGGSLLTIGETEENSVLFDESSVVLSINTEELKVALRPLLKRRDQGVDEPLLHTVLLVDDGESITLKTTDMITFTKTTVTKDGGVLEHPVALDLESFSAVVKFQGEKTQIVITDTEVNVLFAGGCLHVPSYNIDPSSFDLKNSISGKEIDSSRTPIVVLLETIAALKKLAGSAERTEMRMLFGTREHVSACDGTTVMRSDLYFVPTAVKLKDLAIIESLLQASDSFQKAVITEQENYVVIETDVGQIAFPKREAKLAVQYSDALRSPTSYFFVDPGMTYKMLNMLNAVRDTGGHVTFVIEEDDDSPVLVVYSKSTSGRVSQLVVSRDCDGEEGTKPTVGEELRLRIPAAERALSGFTAGGEMIKLTIDKDQMLIDDTRAKAVVLLGAIGSDK